MVGRVVRVNKQPFTILGVAPPEFHGTLLFLFPDFFVPIVNQEQVTGSDYLNARGNRAVFQVMGHLKARSHAGTGGRRSELHRLLAGKELFERRRLN